MFNNGNHSQYFHAINAGLEIATGKYIAIVETDDYVEPDMLSSLYNAAMISISFRS